MTGRALENLDAIYFAINAEFSDQAWAWLEALQERIASLAAFPARGMRTPENMAFRQILYGRRPHLYRIIYAIDDNAKLVSVIHIRHGRQDSFDADEG